MTFTRNKVCGTHLFFQKKRFQDFVSGEILSVKSLGRKISFFHSLGTTKISNTFILSVFIHVVLLINISEQFELCFYFKYSWTYHKSHLFHHMRNCVKTGRWKVTLISGILVFISETSRSYHSHYNS